MAAAEEPPKLEDLYFYLAWTGGDRAVADLHSEIEAATVAAARGETPTSRRRTVGVWIGVSTAVAGLVAAYVGLPLLRGKPQSTNLESLTSADQRGVRSQALQNLALLDWTRSCPPELRAKGAIVDARRAQGETLAEEPTGDEYRAGAARASAANVACGPGQGFPDRYTMRTRLRSGADVVIVFTGLTLPGPDLNIPTICPTLGSFMARMADAPVGSEQAAALTSLAAAAHSYCNLPAAPVATGAQ